MERSTTQPEGSPTQPQSSQAAARGVLLRVSQAAKLAGVTRQTLARRIDRGTLQSVRVEVRGEIQTRIPLEALRELYPEAEAALAARSRQPQPDAAGSRILEGLEQLRGSLEAAGEQPARALSVLVERHRAEVAALRDTLEHTRQEAAAARDQAEQVRAELREEVREARTATERERSAGRRAWTLSAASAALLCAAAVWGWTSSERAVLAAGEADRERDRARTLEGTAEELRDQARNSAGELLEQTRRASAAELEAAGVRAQLEQTRAELLEVRRAEVLRRLPQPAARLAPFPR